MLLGMQESKVLLTGRKCITAGYFHQAARVKGIGEYMNIRTAVCVLGIVFVYMLILSYRVSCTLRVLYMV